MRIRRQTVSRSAASRACRAGGEGCKRLRCWRGAAGPASPAPGTGVYDELDMKDRMTTRAAVLALWIVALTGGVAGAQTDFGAEAGHWLKLDWKVAEQPGRAVVYGYVFNDFGLAARDVSLLVEGLDPEGRVVTRAYGRVPFVVAPGTSGYFETAVAPAARYRVSVSSYTWMHDDDFRPFRRLF